MSKIVNLRRARKEKLRADKQAQGGANAAKHGRTKAQKLLHAARVEKAR